MLERHSEHARCASALFLIALLGAFIAAAERPVRAQAMRDLYQANAIVTGTDMRSRPWGFAQCLREVLVKVSGEPRLRDDPRVAELAAHADRFVTYFDYVDLMAGRPHHDDQGSQFGMKFRIPTETELAAWGVGLDRFPSPEAKLPPGQAIVSGTLDWNEATPGWTGSWRMRRKGVDHAWHVSGVTFDAAFRDIIRGVVLLASGHAAPG